MGFNIQRILDMARSLAGLEPQAPDWVVGADVSEYQGSMRWKMHVEAGSKFVYMRACIGSRVDDQFDRNSTNGNKPEIHGYYFPIRPEMNWADQANLFCDLIEDLPWNLWPAIDIEIEGWYEPLPVVAQIVFDRLGVPPIIYTTGLFWNNNYPEMDWSAVTIRPSDMALWVAIWNDVIQHPWNHNTIYKPISWEDWDVWQYTSAGDGATWGARSLRIDLNRWNGTLAELRALADRITAMRGGETPPPSDLEQRVTNLEGRVDELEAVTRGLGGIIDGLGMRIVETESGLQVVEGELESAKARLDRQDAINASIGDILKPDA